MDTILFLPGLGNDQRVFKHQMLILSKNYHCKTIVCDSANTMQGLVDDILNIAPEKFIVVGHSFGGMVAQWLAILAPERISKLILINTGPGELTPELEIIFKEIIEKAKRGQAQEFFASITNSIVFNEKLHEKRIMTTLKAMQSEFPTSSLINQLQVDLEGRDATPFLKNIQCDCLLIFGKQDPYYLNERLTLKETIPNNDYIEIDCCSHMAPLENPETVSALIELWLKLKSNDN